MLETNVQQEQKQIPMTPLKGPDSLTEVPLGTGNKTILVGEDLSPNIEVNLMEFLTSRLDAFAWENGDITGISPDVITHKLNVDPNHTPIQQKRRKFGAE